MINFRPNLTRLVDYNSTTQNFLFRGNVPLVNNSIFVYDELVSTFDTIVRNQTSFVDGLPDDFFVLDISLLNDLGEAKELHAEKNFFLQNPTLGAFENWIIVGDITNPNDLPAEERKIMAETMQDWQFDKLVERIPQLYSMIHTQAQRPLVVFFHCEIGTDRE